MSAVKYIAFLVVGSMQSATSVRGSLSLPIKEQLRTDGATAPLCSNEYGRSACCCCRCKGAFTLRTTSAAQGRTTSLDVVRGRTTSCVHVYIYYVCKECIQITKWRLRVTFTMSFWLLAVIFTRLANFLVVEIDKLDLDASGFTTCCVVEMTWVNMPDS